ncbi:hypothetical protein J3Q64DRAFT_1740473 [Phycomyces blakesleeanus]|uniref:Uncharacterized protein n=1 Tax=Phycomyces blakesleeanus TaxID=4837 RepID=A0ABR3B1A5_PHYBL
MSLSFSFSFFNPGFFLFLFSDIHIFFTIAFFFYSLYILCFLFYSYALFFLFPPFFYFVHTAKRTQNIHTHFYSSKIK